MFNHPGKKLRRLAILIFVALVIIDLLLALGVSFFFGEGRTGVAKLGTIVGLVVFLVGVVVSWLSVIILYAYGSLVQDVEYIRYYCSRMVKNMEDEYTD